MRWIIAVMAVVGIWAASSALHEHYRDEAEASPCKINDKWDCGLVNHSQYATVAGVPVAAIGIAGYLLIAVLAVIGVWKVLIPTVLGGLVFSLYLTYLEWRVLQIWCIYCVISLAIISTITLLTIGWAVANLRRPKTA